MKLKLGYLFNLKNKHNCKSLAKVLVNQNVYRNSYIGVYVEGSIYNKMPNLELDSNGYAILKNNITSIKPIQFNIIEPNNNMCISSDNELYRSLKHADKKIRIKFILNSKNLIRNVLVGGHFPKTLKMIDRFYNSLFKDFKPYLIYPCFCKIINPRTYELLSRYKDLNIVYKPDARYLEFANLEEIKQFGNPALLQLTYLWGNHSAEVIEYGLNNFDPELIEISLNEKYIEPSDEAYAIIHSRLNYKKISLYNMINKHNIYHALQNKYSTDIRSFNNKYELVRYTDILPRISLFDAKTLSKTSVDKAIMNASAEFSNSVMYYYLQYKIIKYCKPCVRELDESIYINLLFILFKKWDKKDEYIDNLIAKTNILSILKDNNYIISILCRRQNHDNISFIFKLLKNVEFGSFANHECNREGCIIKNVHTRNVKSAKNLIEY